MTNQAFYNYVADQDYGILKPLWNEYISETGNGEQIFESIEDVAEFFTDDAAGLARAVFFGKVENWSDNVYFNSYGNLESGWSVDSSPISVRELATWLEDSTHEFYQEWENEQEESEE